MALPVLIITVSQCFNCAAENGESSQNSTIIDTEVSLATGAMEHLKVQSDRSDDPLKFLPARAAYFRARGEIANSDKWAKRCVDDSAVKAQVGSEALYLCLGILAGNYMWRGDIASWADTMIKVRRLGSNVPALRSSVLFNDAGIMHAPFESFLNWPAISMEKLPSTPVEIPVRYVRGWPIVSAKLTGGRGAKRDIDVEFLVDTGATRSIISPKMANLIGLSSTPDFMRQERRGVVSNLSLVEPVDLNVGGVQFRNVSFSSDERIELNIIGIDLIRQLGPVLLNDEVMRVMGSSWKFTGCTNRLRVTSDPWGRYWNLRSPISIDGVEKLVMADSGMAGLLEVRDTREPQPADAAWTSTTTNTMLGREDRRVRTQTVRLNGSGMNASLLATVVQPMGPPSPPENWLLGGEALQSHNLLIAADWALLCWQKQ